MRRLIHLLVPMLLLAACTREPTPVVVGAAAPSFSLQVLGGGRLESRSLEGEAMILNFWASWCQPCRREIPMLVEVARTNGIRVIGIALDEQGARTVQPFVDRLAISYTVLLGNEETFRRFNGFSIPYTLVLDSARQIVSIYRGPVSRKALERDLERLRT